MAEVVLACGNDGGCRLVASIGKNLADIRGAMKPVLERGDACEIARKSLRSKREGCTANACPPFGPYD